MAQTVHDTSPRDQTVRDIDEMLVRVVDLDGSDLHLSVGSEPAVRIHGELKRLTEYDPLTPQAMRRLVGPMLNATQREQFEATHELDLAYSIAGVGRFRVNVMMQRGSVGAVMRVVPQDVRSLEDLGLPDVVATFAELPRGLEHRYRHAPLGQCGCGRHAGVATADYGNVCHSKWAAGAPRQNA